ncbi:MAG: T9SS type A sorting domain-containing protein [Flavobacteriaceae bacterium]|nr:T9SS type A sorting domain-containing protein [Flavobacteriaceae bacterium]
MMKKLQLNSIKVLGITFMFFLGFQANAQYFTFTGTDADDSAGVGFRDVTTTPSNSGHISISNSMHWSDTSIGPSAPQMPGVDLEFTIDGGIFSKYIDNMVWENRSGSAALFADTKIVFKDELGTIKDTWTLPSSSFPLLSDTPVSILTIFEKSAAVPGVNEIYVTIDYGPSRNTEGFRLISFAVSDDGLGIASNDFTSTTTLYPSPTTGNLSIELGKMYESVSVEITNSLGQVVDSFNKTSINQLQFNIDAAPGVYFIKLSTENNEKAYYKVLKK